MPGCPGSCLHGLKGSWKHPEPRQGQDSQDCPCPWAPTAAPPCSLEPTASPWGVPKHPEQHKHPPLSPPSPPQQPGGQVPISPPVPWSPAPPSLSQPHAESSWHRRELGHSHQGTAPRARRQPGTYTALCISSSLRIILRAVPSKTPFKGVSQQQALQTQPWLSGSLCPPEHQDRPQDEQCKHGCSGGRGLMQEAWKHPRGCSREGRAASPLLLRAPGGSGDLPAPGLGSRSKRCGLTGAVQKRMQAAL